MLGGFVRFAFETRSQPIGSLELTPPEFDPEDPSVDAIRAELATASAA